MNPGDIITWYCLLAPFILSLCFYVLYKMDMQQNVVFNFPNLVLCGRVDTHGTTIDVPGNGALMVYGRKLTPNSTVYLLEVKNG